ncbi:MAG: hypothetical protein R2879_01440 [Saprospiraceae bacterium]
MRFIFLLLPFVLLACKTKQTNAPNQEPITCKTKGTVKDFTGLDGCKFLIILHDGTKLLPAKVNDKKFQFREGQEIMFDYEDLSDYGMTICMAEDQIVEITCIHEVGKDPALPSDCSATLNPMEIPWMKTLMESYKPFRVVRYDFQEQYLYYFQAAPVAYLHDCKGDLVCEVPGKMLNDCYAQIQALGQGKVIYLKQ